jgi:hypothetical protein
MLKQLCQLKSLAIILLLGSSSCSFFGGNKASRQGDRLLTPIKGKWFVNNPAHSLWDLEGSPLPHDFFDASPDFSKSNTFVHAVITTPEGSEHQYELDPQSGQRHYSFSYCPQSDIWNNFSGEISRPLYSIGVIPRLIDQSGGLQKVYIFGGKKKYSTQVDHHEHRIRLVGAVVEQTCPIGNCLEKGNWISRMVFLGVDPQDKDFGEIKDVMKLERALNWIKVRAVMENLAGRNDSSGGGFPHIRIGRPITLEAAIDYYKDRSIFLSHGETDEIRKNCHLLYDRLWADVGADLEEDRPATNSEELKNKLKLIEQLKKQRLVGFANRFRSFATKYGNEYGTCQRYVYAGNLNLKPEVFWFHVYASIFFRLHKEGHHFDCRTRSWHEDLADKRGWRATDFERSLKDCQDKDIDKAMNSLSNYLEGLRNSNSTYFRFVDYDTHTFGTHQKLYSWVKVIPKKFECTKDPNLKIRSEMKILPADVVWKNKYVRDIKDKLKIIY